MENIFTVRTDNSKSVFTTRAEAKIRARNILIAKLFQPLLSMDYDEEGNMCQAHINPEMLTNDFIKDLPTLISEAEECDVLEWKFVD